MMRNLCQSLIITAGLVFTVPVMAALTEAGSYRVDLAHTNVGFKVSHLGISLVVGRFNMISGDIEFAPGGNSSVEIEIDTASVDTNNQRRDNHLRSGDFFNVNSFPKMRFSSSDVLLNESGDPLEIRGTLTLHGVTQSVILKVKTLGAGKGFRGMSRVGFEATTTIKRTDFGMDKFLAVAGDEVDIIINVEVIKK